MGLTVVSTSQEPQINFDDFWKLYPRRQAKKEALKAWVKIDPAEHPKILRGIMQAKKSEQWTKDEGRYIPMPATYLNGERWNDEMEIEVEVARPAGPVIDGRCQHHGPEGRCAKGVSFWNRNGTKGNCFDHGPI